MESDATGQQALPRKTLVSAEIKAAALAWADFLYREYYKEKALSISDKDNTITLKPTQHDQASEE